MHVMHTCGDKAHGDDRVAHFAHSVSVVVDAMLSSLHREFRLVLVSRSSCGTRDHHVGAGSGLQTLLVFRTPS